MYDEEFNKSLWNIPYYAYNLNNKLQHEVGDFLHKNTNNPDMYGNDLRHQYTSALYARNKGNTAAKILGELNEFFDFSGSGREDTDIDKINNQIGREYGLKYPDMPRGQLLYKLLTDWDKNVQRQNIEMQKKGYKNYGK